MAKRLSEEVLDELRVYPISYRLEQIRVLLGYTQQEAAVLIGCKQGAISTWESGKYTPRSITLVKICQAYGLPNDYFTDYNIQKVILTNQKKREIGEDDSYKRFENIEFN